jgi:hypothetical protein
MAERLAKKEWDTAARLVRVLDVAEKKLTTTASLAPADTIILEGHTAWVPNVGDLVLIISTEVGSVCLGKVEIR